MVNNSLYTSDLLLGLYNLARNYYLCGFFDEAEKICTGLITLSEKSTPARLLSAAIQLEQGNFSLAANHYRIASQDQNNNQICRVGILACYLGQKDMARASNLAKEIQQETSTFTPELNAFFEEQLKSFK